MDKDEWPVCDIHDDNLGPDYNNLTDAQLSNAVFTWDWDDCIWEKGVDPLVDAFFNGVIKKSKRHSNEIWGEGGFVGSFDKEIHGKIYGVIVWGSQKMHVSEISRDGPNGNIRQYCAAKGINFGKLQKFMHKG